MLKGLTLVGRKGFGEQVKEKATPQQDKSLFEKAKETVTGTADQAASKVRSIVAGYSNRCIADEFSAQRTTTTTFVWQLLHSYCMLS